MKILDLLIIAFAISSCKEKDSQEPMTIDTVCTENLDSLSNSDVRVLSACDILFPDSTNADLNRRIGSGRLEAETNFEKSTLNYTSDKDTILVDLFFINFPGKRYYLTNIDSKNDSVFIELKAKPNSQNLHSLKEIAVHKYSIRFIYKGKPFPTLIRHLPQ